MILWWCFWCHDCVAQKNETNNTKLNMHTIWYRFNKLMQVMANSLLFSFHIIVVSFDIPYMTANMPINIGYVPYQYRTSRVHTRHIKYKYWTCHYWSRRSNTGHLISKLEFSSINNGLVQYKNWTCMSNFNTGWPVSIPLQNWMSPVLILNIQCWHRSRSYGPGLNPGPT